MELHRKTYVHLNNLPLFVIIIEADCVVCEIQAETKEMVYNVNITTELD
jgi:hypothetical protein